MRETRFTTIPCGECYNRGMNKICDSIEEGNQVCFGESGKRGLHSREDTGVGALCRISPLKIKNSIYSWNKQ